MGREDERIDRNLTLERETSMKTILQSRETQVKKTIYSPTL